MLYDAFYIKATETVTITGNGKEPQTVEGVEITPSKNTISIKDYTLPNEDYFFSKNRGWDIIQHINKAGITENYKVKSASYEDRKNMEHFDVFPNEIV
jgi:hypothetical protein